MSHLIQISHAPCLKTPPRFLSRELRTITSCVLIGGVLSGVCQTSSVTPTNSTASPTVAEANSHQTNQPTIDRRRVERVRAACLNGRRSICGRVLQVSPAGLVVESGYTNLLRAPFNKSWLVSRTVSASRDVKAIEMDEPGSPCVGLVLLTTFPKTPAVNLYDYVIIQGYPAGAYEYSPLPGVQKTIRKFSAGLETAVQFSLSLPKN